MIFSEVRFGPTGDSGVKRDMQKRAHKTSVVLGEIKVIHDLLTDSWEVYRRADDPGEQRNLVNEQGASGVSVKTLKAAVIDFELSQGKISQQEVEYDASELEELRKLGYVR